MNVHNERPGEKLWKDLSPEQVEWFFKLCAAQADKLSDLADKALMDFWKYLFTSNAGAAAGLLALFRASPTHVGYLYAFFMFIGGTFLIGLAHFLYRSFAFDVSEGWSSDMNAWGRNELTISALDGNYRKRRKGSKGKWAMLFLGASFLLLIIGGATAGITLWLATRP